LPIAPPSLRPPLPDTPSDDRPETPAQRLSWVVRMHYRMRTAAFGMLFLAVCLHARVETVRADVWLFLGLLLIVYPHLQFRRAQRSSTPLDTEMHNLSADSLLLGMSAAALGFPLWITFSSLLGTLSNNTANKGWPGVAETLLAFSTGALLGGAIWGFRLVPGNDLPTTLLCIVCLTAYLVAMGHIAFTRIQRLRDTREALQQRERDLMAANAALQRNLREIDALQEQLREQAIRDPLTGLYNRRYLDATLERELARARRDGQPLALILMDLDHFKRVNDTYGHQAGDEVLQQLARLLNEMARAGDVASRHGGEEFLLLMPTMSLATARERAETLRRAFGALEIPFGSLKLRATLSIGIAASPDHGSTAEDLFRHADRALYQAKHEGRNRVAS